jgi:ATP adenylyltransferase
MDRRPLWAPWRIEYILGAKDGECIFCRAGSGDDDATAGVIDRGAHCVTMLNAYPYASGHLMISPYRHVGDLEALDDNESLDLMRLARRATTALRAAMHPDGFNAGLNLGTVAGAGFAEHLHLHVVPRWHGDTSFMPVIGGAHVVPQALDATRRLLADAIGRLDNGDKARCERR